MLIILLMTFNPFYLAWPEKLSFKFQSSFDNLILNLILFLPVGFLYRLIARRRGAILLGGILSFAIEMTQAFIPARTTSVVDVLANALGAGVGAWMCSLVDSRVKISTSMVNRLRLETPLMGLAYLLVPLLWINTLALNEAPYHWILTVLIGIFGAVIFSDLFRHWWQIIDVRVMGYASIASGLWFFTGAGPRLMSSLFMIALGFGVMLLTALLTILPKQDKERRFEQNTLRRILPIFAVYLLLLSLWFPFSPFGVWHGYFGFTDRITDTSLYALYPRLEYLAAFTVLGYLIAEWRGRLELPLAQDLPRLLFLATSIALILEILSGFQSGRGASVVRLFLAVSGAAFGGTIYHLSRAHIRYLLGR